MYMKKSLAARVPPRTLLGEFMTLLQTSNWTPDGSRMWCSRMWCSHPTTRACGTRLGLRYLNYGHLTVNLS